MGTKVQGLLALAAIGAVVGGVACLDGSASDAANDRGKASSGQVVGKVGDRTITLEEVDRAAMRANLQAFQQVYDVRRQALETLIEEELLSRAAAAQGVAVEALVEVEIAGKTKPVTDDDVQRFYDQNRNRMGGRSFEQVSGQVREYLTALNATEARKAYVDGLREGSGVEMRLDPPRVEVLLADNDPARGPAGAKVTIVEYSDFQ